VHLRVRRRDEQVAAERCPYCHDLIAALPRGELVTCAGCGTQHHEACLAEIGRCTVHGCGRAVRLVSREPLDPERSAAWRAVAQQLRERAWTFVRAHCKSADPGPATPERLRQVLLEADAARRERRWLEAGRAYDVAAVLLAAWPRAPLDEAGLRVTSEDVRALSGMMWDRVSGLHEQRDIPNRLLAWALGVVAVTVALSVLVLLLQLR
jgi:hypothetical protein